MKGIVQAEQCVMYVRAYVIWLMHLIDYLSCAKMFPLVIA